MDYQQPPGGPGGYPPPNPQDPYGQQGYPQQDPGYYNQQGYPQQDPYYTQQPPPGAYPPPQGTYPPPYGTPYPSYDSYPGKGKATASLVLGIVACVLMWLGYGVFLAFVVAIIGLILGISARKSIPAGMPGAGAATAGFVLSLIALILSVIIFVGCLVCIGSLSSLSRSAYYW